MAKRQSADAEFAVEMKAALKTRRSGIGVPSNIKRNSLTPKAHYDRLLSMKCSADDASHISGYQP